MDETLDNAKPDQTPQLMFSEGDKHTAIVEQVMRGPRAVENFFRTCGIDDKALPELSFDDLREAAFADEFPGLCE